MPASSDTDLLIIGAGPFGVAAAAYAQHKGIDHIVLGEPMGFWKAHMPKGMLLRSACDWHLDPMDVHTIEAYLATLGLTPREVEPLSLDFYLDYCAWFLSQKHVESARRTVTKLNAADDGARFEARLDDGGVLGARSVLIAVGMGYFANVPAETAALLPEGRYGHTRDVVEFARFAGKRVLIIGGRQSAFEWAALLAEAGASAVHVSYRHDTPAFTESDWSWVPATVERICTTPSWYRSLSEEERAAIGARLWGEGRLKLEPWLAGRIARQSVRLWPRSSVARCDAGANGTMVMTLDNAQQIEADHVIFATGYRADIGRVPFLAAGKLLPAIAARNGYPVLDEHFQSSVPGLYFTSMAAAGDFGPFFGFTVSVRGSARSIGDHVAASREG